MKMIAGAILILAAAFFYLGDALRTRVPYEGGQLFIVPCILGGIFLIVMGVIDERSSRRS